MEKYTFKIPEDGKIEFVEEGSKNESKTESGDSEVVSRRKDINKKQPEEDYEKLFSEDEKKPGKVSAILWIVGLSVVIIVGFFLVVMLRKYTDYKVVQSWEVKNATAAHYANFKGCVLKYSSDGAILTDEKGKVIWNEGYEMSSPHIDINGEYLIIYDKGGSSIYIMTNAGEKSVISTTEPIDSAEVSAQGTVAMVAEMNRNTAALVEMYGLRGDIIASGKIHLENGGYPTDIALSSDGKVLVISTVGFEKGTERSSVYFYNFGSAGKNEIDNIVASFKYEGTIIPEVDINSKNEAVAIGSDKIILYSGGSKPSEKDVIKPAGEMKSVFHNDSYVGFIVPKKDDDGKMTDTLEMYTMRGFKRYSRKIDMEYTNAKLLNDNEFLITDGNELKIINIFGMEKLEITGEDDLYDVLSKKAGREYYFIRTEKIDQIKLQ